MSDTDVEALIASAVRRLVEHADSTVLDRFARGEVDLAFVVANPIAAMIAGKPIETAYGLLKAQTTPKLKSYFGPPKLIATHPVPPTPEGLARNAVGAYWIAQVLTDAYGRAYEPPAPAAKQPRARAAGSATPKRTAPKPTPMPFSASAVIAKLNAATSRAEARELLSGVKAKKDVQALARTVGVEFKERTTADDLRETIYEVTVAPRLATGVFMSMGSGPE